MTQPPSLLVSTAVLFPFLCFKKANNSVSFSLDPLPRCGFLLVVPFFQSRIPLCTRERKNKRKKNSEEEEREKEREQRGLNSSLRCSHIPHVDPRQRASATSITRCGGGCFGATWTNASGEDTPPRYETRVSLPAITLFYGRGKRDG